MTTQDIRRKLNDLRAQGVIINEKTKLSEIAKVIEMLPLGEKLECIYRFDEHVFTRKFDTSLPILDINIDVLIWMTKCQLESM